MNEPFRVSGYPISQLIISGLISGVCAIPIVALAITGKPIHPALLIATIGMFTICLAAVVAQPYVIISVDSGKETVTVRWISFCGIISRARNVRVKNIQKLVYGVTTFEPTFRSRPGKTQPTGSRHSFYALMTGGAHEFLLPKAKTSPGLSKKLGIALSKYLDIPFVRHTSGSGRFQEEPMQST